MPDTLHRLLRRQLIRFFGQAENVPDTMQNFVEAVNETYCQLDDDRAILEQSLEMSSQELLQANSDMRAICQVFPDLFLRLDSEGTILDYKAGSETDFFTDPKTLQGRRIQDIPVPKVGIIFDNAIRKMKQTKSQVNIEYSFQIQSRKIFYEARFLPLPENEIITIIRDITESKEIERELRSKGELLYATLESTADAILVFDENDVATHANTNFAKMWDIPQEVMEKRDETLLINHALSQLQDPQGFLEKIQEHRASIDLSFDILSFKDGRIIERISHPVKKEGHVAGRILSFRDVTKRVMSEKRIVSLNQLKEKLLGLGDLSEKLRYITDTVVETLNADFARIWIKKPADLCNSGCYHASATDSLHTCHFREQCLHLMASSGRYTHLDGKIHQRVPFGGYKIGKIAASVEPGFCTNDVTNDSRIYDQEWASKLGLVSFVGQRILSANGEPAGVLAFFSRNIISRDEYAFCEAISNIASQVIQTTVAEEERRQLQEKLEHAERMGSLANIAGDVAHDLNNMLGPLVDYPKLILTKLPEDSPVRKQIERVSQAVRDADDVIQDLLTLTRRGRYEMEPTDLNNVIQTCLDSPDYTRLYERFQDVSVQIRLDESLPRIIGSSAHLSKVIKNLVINAFNAVPRGATICIETSQESLSHLQSGYDNIKPGDYVVLRVCNSGMGIANEDLPKVFEPSYSTKCMSIGGSRLGLSVVYGIIKDHRGYYDIFSDVGKGTEFILYFPVCEDTLSISRPKINIEGGTESILVIDDSTEQRELAVNILSALGYNVRAAENGTAGVRFLQSEQVDLVMLDMFREPGFDGLGTYLEIIKLHSGQKAIIVSGFAPADQVEWIKQLGAETYIRKPYTREKIATAVRRELDNVSIQKNHLSNTNKLLKPSFSFEENK